MIFEWDEEKNKINQLKHGIDFVTASLVFADPLHVIKVNDIVEGEMRYEAIGRIDYVHRALLVIHTYKEGEQEIIRIISARKLSKKEVIRYGYTR